MMLRLVAAGLFLIAVARTAAAEPPENKDAVELPVTGMAEPEMAPFDELMTSFVTKHKIPGAALAVTKNGRLVYARGFGFADREEQEPVQPDSLFRIASISKPVTAVAVLQLVERGKLKLDDRCFELLDVEPVVRQGKEPDPRLKEVTIRQLLQHTGGWDRDKSFDPMFRPIVIARAAGSEPPAKQLDIIRYMAGQPLDFDPGERYAYSNFGYCLLGRVIEKVSGQPYEEYVREQVLRPLGIRGMRLGKTLPDGRAEGEVKYYEDGKTAGAVIGPEPGKPVPLPYGAWHLEAMDAHGGWIASAVDLVRFASAFDYPQTCKVLRAKSIASMFARPAGNPGFDAEGKPRDAYYGLGWSVRPVGNLGQSTQWHTGSLDGTSTILVRRHDGLNWAVLFNTRNATPGTAPARAIDGLMHQAADAIKRWPPLDQFREFR